MTKKTPIVMLSDFEAIIRINFYAKLYEVYQGSEGKIDR